MIFYYNSLSSLSAWPNEELHIKRALGYFLGTQMLHNSSPTWFDEFEPRIPRQPLQNDVKSCGLFVMMYMKAWSGHVPDHVEKCLKGGKAFDQMRKRFCVDLLVNPHNSKIDFVKQKVSLKIQKHKEVQVAKTSTVVSEENEEAEARKTTKIESEGQKKGNAGKVGKTSQIEKEKQENLGKVSNEEKKVYERRRSKRCAEKGKDLK